MTTLIPYAPRPNAAFSTQITLDGNPYTLIVNYNLWGFSNDGVNKRPYINVLTLSGALVICAPMVGSPLGYDISLLPPALGFTSTIVYRIDTGMIEISP